MAESDSTMGLEQIMFCLTFLICKVGMTVNSTCLIVLVKVYSSCKVKELSTFYSEMLTIIMELRKKG